MGNRFAFVMVMVAIVFPVAACTTPPAEYTFQKSRTYDKSKDAVWEKVVQYFTTQNIPLKTIEKDSGVVYAERIYSTGDALNGLVDCGDPGIAIVVRTTVAVNVFVRPLSKNKTEATVNTTYSQTRSFDNQLAEFPCNSTGGLEAQILAAL